MRERDYLTEDFVPKNQRYAVFSYFVNKGKNSENIPFMYKIKGTFKTVEAAKTAIARYTDEDKKFHNVIVDTGKWIGGYSDAGIMNMKNADNIIYGNASLNEIMKDKQDQLKKAEDEHKNRVEMNRHISKVHTCLRKTIHLLHREGFVQIDYPDVATLEAREQEKENERKKRRKEPETLAEYHKECMEKEIKEFTFLRDIEELKTGMDRATAEKETDPDKRLALITQMNLQNVYDKIVDDEGNHFKTLEEMCRKVLEDMNIYKNFIDNYEYSLKITKDDIDAQISELQAKRETIEETEEENLFNKEQIERLNPFDIL